MADIFQQDNWKRRIFGEFKGSNFNELAAFGLNGAIASHTREYSSAGCLFRVFLGQAIAGILHGPTRLARGQFIVVTHGIRNDLFMIRTR